MLITAVGHVGVVRSEMSSSQKRYWYAMFRTASYFSVFGALVWTVAMVIPFAPFSDIPPILVGGGPGQWLVVAYLLYLALGGGGFGWLSGLLYTIEKAENRVISPSLMWPGFLMLFLGVTASCVSLGYAGAVGGYSSIINGASTASLKQFLSPFVYPITATVVVAVAGAVLVLLAMIRARGP
jgi:hypothetical protein